MIFLQKRSVGCLELMSQIWTGADLHFLFLISKLKGFEFFKFQSILISNVRSHLQKKFHGDLECLQMCHTTFKTDLQDSQYSIHDAFLSTEFPIGVTSLSPIRKKYPDVTIQPDSRCIVGLGGGNTVSGLVAARTGNVHSPWPAGPVIIQLALASVRGYRR